MKKLRLTVVIGLLIHLNGCAILEVMTRPYIPDTLNGPQPSIASNRTMSDDRALKELLETGTSTPNPGLFQDSQEIVYWTSFSMKNGKILSYEHVKGASNTPRVYNIKGSVGYLYFLIKIDDSQEELDRLQTELKKQYPEKLENHKFAYAIHKYRINCKDEIIEPREVYLYSDKNHFIMVFDMSKTNKSELLKGSRFENIPFSKEHIKKAKEEIELKDKLTEYGAETLVPISQLEVNPYEFEGHTIAVVVQFKKMLSRNMASFYSGYTDTGMYTNVCDEIIVTGIPKGMHFESGLFSPRMMLALKGRGIMEGTNAFGGRIKAPHFQWVGIISGKQPSVFEEQQEDARKNALQSDPRPSSRSKK